MLLKPLEPLLEEALPPLAHYLAGHVESLGDLAVGEAISGQERYLGPNHLTIL
jgi:hypothetical protein